MKTIKANKLASKVLKALDSYRFTYDELQIDCDWSLNSKANYFEFLKLLKTNLNKNPLIITTHFYTILLIIGSTFFAIILWSLYWLTKAISK